MKKVLVVAPHPDDETLGCGGTLLKHKDNGDEIHWVIITGISEEQGYTVEKVKSREKEIKEVANKYQFSSVSKLNLPTTKLDTIPRGDIVGKVSNVIEQVGPEILYIPYRGDIHTDHKYVFDAVLSCTKWFRYCFIKRVLVYETLSETEFGINPDNNGFRPNVFMAIEKYMDQKIEIMNIFESEVGDFPFPRSVEAIRSLAAYRGTASGSKAAEAFMLLKEVL